RRRAGTVVEDARAEDGRVRDAEARGARRASVAFVLDGHAVADGTARWVRVRRGRHASRGPVRRHPREQLAPPALSLRQLRAVVRRDDDAALLEHLVPLGGDVRYGRPWAGR